MSGGAAIIVRQNRYFHAFRIAGATSVQTAKTLKEMDIVPNGIFYRLEKAGVFEKSDGDRYFMNQEKAQEYFIRRRKYAWIMVGLIGIVILIAYMLNGTI